MSNTPHFLQLHTLTSYPGTLLNRDDAGFAKRLTFGGASRTRISSQCLKRHWRRFEGEGALSELGDRSIRSRRTFYHYLAQPLLDAGHPMSLVIYTAACLMTTLIKGKFSASDVNKLYKDNPDALDAETNAGRLHTAQVTVLGHPEMAYLRQLAEELLEAQRETFGARWEEDAPLTKDERKALGELAKARLKDSDLRKNLSGMVQAAGLDAALFGRMVTSDLLARGDAAIHVAHAFTVHREASETDYFSAVDDLLQDGEEGGELGSGHINSSELTSGLFYSYVVVDVPLLVSNLTGCARSAWRDAERGLACDVIARLIPIIATVTPGAKLGSTAPYARAWAVMVESGASQPRTLANAFMRPVVEGRDGLIQATYDQLAGFITREETMYGSTYARALSAQGPYETLTQALGLDAPASLADTARWAAEQARSA